MSSTSGVKLSSDSYGAPISSSGADALALSEWEFLARDDEDDEFRLQRAVERDAIVFLIDARPRMYEPMADGTRPLDAVLQAAVDTLEAKIIQSDADLIAFAFFGTEQRRNANEFDRIYVLSELDRPDATSIETLERFQKTVRAGERLEFGAAPACSLADALWTASTLFSACTLSMGTRRVFLFTDDDSPAATPAAREQALQRAKDLGENDVQLVLFGITLERRFDYKLFYHDVLLRVCQFSEEEAEAAQLSMADLDELRASVKQRQFKQRALSHFTLRLGHAGGRDVEIGLDLFSLNVRATKGSPYHLDARSLQILKSDTRYVCDTTGTLLLDHQMQFAREYGHARIMFTREELARIKTTGARHGLELLGFKPRSALKEHHNVRNAMLLYPNEKVVRGGTTAFAALVEQMAALDRIGIASMAARANAPPRLVALLPQREKRSEDDVVQELPTALIVIPLPFADDVRHLEVPALPAPDTETLRSMRGIVNAAQITGINLPDPALQKFYANLQALALNRDEVVEVKDTVQPAPEMAIEANKHLQAFASRVFPDGYKAVMPRTPTAGQKRPRTAASPKVERTNLTTLSDEQMRELVPMAKFKRYTVPELKEYLAHKRVSVPSKATKDVLLTAVARAVGVDVAGGDESSPKVKKAKTASGEADTSTTSAGASSQIIKSESTAKSEPSSSVRVASITEDDGFNLPEQLPADTDAAMAQKPMCKYGAKCYRTNPLHLQSFRHPPKSDPQ